MNRKRKKHPALYIIAGLGAMSVYNRTEYKKATAGNINHKEECRVFYGRFGDIAYKRMGKGKPLLLIHDLSPSSNLYEWSKVMEQLAQNYSVYAIDLPGCGNSDKHNIEYSAYMYALAINDFVKNRICRNNDDRTINAVASCASSPLLICAAALNASLYDHIGLINPKTVEMTYCNPCTNPYITKFLRYVYNTPIIGSFIFNLAYSRKNILAQLSGTEYSRISMQEQEEMADSMYEAAHIGGFNSRFLHSSIHGGLLAIDIIRMLKKLTTDCFIISGENSKDCDRIIAAFREAKEDIRTTVVDDTGILHLEDPDKFVKLLQRNL